MSPRLSSASALLAASVLLAGCFFTNPPVDVESAESSSPTLENYRSARADLYKAVAALGGADAMSGFQDMAFRYKGVVRSRGQSANPTADYHERTVDGWFVFDAAGKVVHESDTEFLGGNRFAFRRYHDGTEGWTHMLSPNEISDLTAFDIGFLQNVAQASPQLTIPHNIVRLALANPTSIRTESGPESAESCVSMSTGTGLTRTIVVDTESGLPKRIQYLGTDPLVGDVQMEVRYLDYRSAAGLRVPHRLEFVTAGELMETWTLSELEINSSPDEKVFERPANAKAITLKQPWQPEEVGDGVYAIRLFSGMGFSYNTMLVELDDHFALVEAPLTDFFFGVIQGAAAQLAPEKPIEQVVSTHYHFDHIGGLKSFMAAGATVFTVPANAGVLKDLAQADHTLQQNPLAGRTEPLPIRVVRGREVLDGGARTIELIDVGPSPHVDEMLVAWVPEADVMFVADLFSSFQTGNYPEPAEALTQFAAALEDLGIRPAVFVPAHGPTVSWAEFARAARYSMTNDASTENSDQE